MLPLAVPGLVLAFGYISMTQEGQFFAFLNPVEGSRRCCWSSPMRCGGCRTSCAAPSPACSRPASRLEEAAQNLGCPPLRTLWRITFPLIAANVLAGGLLAFSFAMLEVSDSLILAQKQAHFPITKAIYELFQLLGEGRSSPARWAFGRWSSSASRSFSRAASSAKRWARFSGCN